MYLASKYSRVLSNNSERVHEYLRISCSALVKLSRVEISLHDYNVKLDRIPFNFVLLWVYVCVPSLTGRYPD